MARLLLPNGNADALAIRHRCSGERLMVAVVSIRMFDLAFAPPELQEETSLTPLRPVSPEAEQVIVHMRVGDYDVQPGDKPGADDGKAVTFGEYRLHKWFEELGAGVGETVLLTWGGSDPLLPH